MYGDRFLAGGYMSQVTVNVISNFEKTRFGVEIFETDGRGKWVIHEGIDMKYSKEDAHRMAKDLEVKLGITRG